LISLPVAPVYAAGGTWEQQAPLIFEGHAMTSIGPDSILLFGGSDPLRNETWIYNISTNAWTHKAPTVSPSARSGATLVDIGSSRALLFGGLDASGRSNETWIYDLDANTWTQQSLAVSPPARAGHAAAYLGGKVIVFGGSGDSGVLADTWTYNVTTRIWTNTAPSAHPSARMYHGMAALNATQVLLFGGSLAPGMGGLSDETWLYTPGTNTWVEDASISGISARARHGMVQVASNQVLLFGGALTNGLSAETWIYDTNHWVLQSLPNSPSERYAPLARSGTGKIFLFGGTDNTSWIYNPIGKNWQGYAYPPHSNECHAMASLGGDKAMWVGNDLGDPQQLVTWVYDRSAQVWIDRTTSGPSARICHAMAPLSTGTALLFGGLSTGMSSKSNETWVYDDATHAWSKKSIAGPSARMQHQMANLSSNMVLLFGGLTDSGLSNETWVYDGSTWTHKNPANAPSARSYAGMAGIGPGKVVLFGGNDANGRSDETWVYDLASNTWTLRNPTTHPTARAGHAMSTYNLAAEQALLFGGYSGVANDETWIYDFASNHWSYQNPASRPSARSGQAMAYLGTGYTILSGGEDGEDGNRENWLSSGFSVPATNAAPVLKINDNLTLTGIPEDPASNPGTLVITLLASGDSGDPISDADAEAQDGIAITGVSASSSNGTWQFSLNNGTTWSDLGSPSLTAARLLIADATTRLRFVPDLNYYGEVSLSFRAWDVTSGSAGETINTSSPGPSASYSVAIATASQTITAVNDPPTITAIADRSTNEDSATGAIAFIIGDVETADGSLTVDGWALNPSLVPTANIVFSGSGANRTVTITPGADQNGSTDIQIRVWDGSSSTIATFKLTVNPVNDAPTISVLNDRTTNEDTTSPVQHFVIEDLETPAASLTVSGSSGDVNIVPDANISFSGTGTDRSVRVTPADNQYGSVVITVTVRDANGATASRSFTLTITPVNDLPTISLIFNQTTNEDTPITVNFTIGDVETPAGSLTLSKSSGNTDLVPDANISFGGSGTDRTVSLTPAANQYGSVVITITVHDADGGSSDRMMVLSVTAVNDLPTISIVNNQTIDEDSSTGALSFTVGDIETAAGSLVVIATSSNTALVPDAKITFGGSGANRTITVTPLANQNGSTGILLRVIDEEGGFSETSFVVQVRAVNDPPTITAIADQTINVNTVTPALSFTIGDVERAANLLLLSRTSSNPSLVPDGNITIGGTGANRTVTVTPLANQTGTATITLRVSDGSITTSTNFVLTVNSLPTISDIGDQITAKNVPTGVIAFTVGDLETAAGSLTISATSSNPGLVPDGNIVPGGTGANRTVQITPAADQKGRTTITVTVADGSGGSASDSFELIVTPTILRAAENGSATSACDTWGNACTLQRALTLAAADDDIWVKAGTYTPGTTRDSSFNLKNGVRMYGGFAGTETLRSQRNWATNVSILSGEISGNNICHVVKASWVGSSTVLDGFTISGGNADLDGTICGSWNGGGMHLGGSNPLLANLIIRDNNAASNGSGIFMVGGSPTLFNVVLRNNTGGALSSGMYVDGSPTLINVTFWKNTTGLWTTAASSVTIHNSIFWGNAIQIVLNGTTNTVTYSLIQSGCPTYATCTALVSGNPDPLFGNTITGDLRLRPGSPAIDVGDNSRVPLDTYDVDGDWDVSERFPYDAAAVARFVDQPSAAPVGAIIDLGAYETGLNHAPVLNYGANLAMSALSEDPASNPGIVISTLLSPSYLGDMISDPDPGAVEGIAVTGAQNTFGQWQYSLNGTDWSNVGTVSDASARLLPVTASLRFAPNANASGTSLLTLRAWDLTSGSSYGLGNTIPNGGTTAFSDTVNWVNQTVFPVNDAPTISAIADQTIAKNTSTGALAFTIDDVESGASALTPTVSSSNPGLVPDGNIVLSGSGANYTLTITPNANLSGATILTISVSDGDKTTTSSFTVTVVMVPLRVVPDPDGLSTGNCATWATGCTLQYALSIAMSGDDIWVKAGTYIPGTTRASTFNLKSGVGVYGGFAGNESTRSARNWGQNVSLLSGEIDGDNVCHVVSATSVSGLLDGFTVAGGYARGDECASGMMYTSGGGILSNFSDLRLYNVILRDNQAYGGAGLTLWSGSGTLFNVTLLNNGANVGGGILAYAGSSTLTNVTFYNNNHLALAVLFNTDLNIRNSIFWGNDGAIDTIWPDPEIYNSIVMKYSLSQNGCTGTTSCSNLIAGNPNPLFVNASSGDLRLKTSSPAIDVGNNSFVPADSYDWDGDGNTSEAAPYDGAARTRFYDHPSAAPVGAIVDLGAYETGPNTAPTLSGLPVTPVTANEDTATTAIPFTVSDLETNVNLLTVTASAQDLSLVPDGNIAISTSGGNRTLVVTPAANQSGTSKITVSVSDGYLTTSGEFYVIFNPVNDAPVNTVLPVVSGTSPLTTTNGTWNDDLDGGSTTLTYTYQWQLADAADGSGLADISGATTNTYTPVAADSGKFIRVKVTATDNGIPGTASASAVSAFVKGTPTASSVSNPTAMPQAGGAIRLNWSVLSDVGIAGFNIYRRIGTSGALVQVNPQLILLSDNGTGKYFWIDTNVQAGVGYEYHLEIVWTSGEREWAGQVWIPVPKNQMYVPVVSR
jgi:N-acetylneuraminic acid mutarotase